MKIDATIKLQRASGFTLDVKFVIEPSGITALYGPSGSGKSTILQLIAGIEQGSRDDEISIKADHVTWHANDEFVAPEARGIGYVFQQSQLFPHLDVKGNLAYATKRRHSSHGPATEQVIEWLDLAPLMHKQVHELSGGESQRVAIGRVLLSYPKCILMDEPLGAIDSRARKRILPYLDKLHDQLDIPMVYVSHAWDEITYLADRIFMLEDGEFTAQGSLFDLGSSLDINLNETEPGAVVHCQVIETDSEYELVELDFEGARIYMNSRDFEGRGAVRVRLPARDISITTNRPDATSILNVIPATIDSIGREPGANVLLRLNHGKQYFLSRITRKSFDHLNLAIGQSVYAQIKSVALLSERL